MESIKESLAQLKNKFIILCQAIGYSWKCFWLTTKGQHPRYEILQLAHRLEKGLLNENPKPLWGWEKAERIATLLKVNNDEFSNRTGRGVLKAYIEAKENSDNIKERERAIKFIENHPEVEKEKTYGGTLLVNRMRYALIIKRLLNVSSVQDTVAVIMRISWYQKMISMLPLNLL